MFRFHSSQHLPESLAHMVRPYSVSPPGKCSYRLRAAPPIWCNFQRPQAPAGSFTSCNVFSQARWTMPCSTCPHETSPALKPGLQTGSQCFGEIASAGKINAQKARMLLRHLPLMYPSPAPALQVPPSSPRISRTLTCTNCPDPWPPQVPGLHGFECEKDLRTHPFLVSKHAEHVRGIDGRLPTDPAHGSSRPGTSETSNVAGSGSGQPRSGRDYLHQLPALP